MAKGIDSNIRFSPELYDALKAEHGRTGASMAEIVRRSLMLTLTPGKVDVETLRTHKKRIEEAIRGKR